MRISLFVICALAAAAGPAAAQTAFPSADQLDLPQCLAATSVDPSRARELAAQWAALGGGAAAAFCAGEALEAVSADRAAAQNYLQAGVEGGVLTSAQRIEALDRAGALWLEADEIDLAARSYQAALTIDPQSRAGRIGAARAAAARGDFATAEAQLSAYIELGGGGDADALALRAAARRGLERFDEARDDAAAATQADPTLSIAWFELGAANNALGDVAGAREAWIQAALIDRNAPASYMAEEALQRLELGE